jgi:RimJ/RimL family protein N-acetyltransferase
MNNYLQDTIDYYSHWLDLPPAVFDSSGVTVKMSPKRDLTLLGYQAPFSLYCLLRNNTVLLSCSPSLNSTLPGVLTILENDCSFSDKINALERILPTIRHSIKFYYSGQMAPIDTTDAVQLEHKHYDQFLAFYKGQSMENDPGEWLYPYYLSLVERGYCFGIFKDGLLVSATDAPDMPYMADRIVEIGINTLKENRGRGYAKIVVAAMIKYLVQSGKTPLWSCAADNQASAGLALAVGYAKFAELLYVKGA